MIRRQSAQFAASALAGAVTFLVGLPAHAQQASTAAGSSSRPRSTDERVNTELGTPPPVNSDYRRAAEGTLPLVPGGTTPITGGAAIDPAARPLTGVNALATVNPNQGPALAPGMDAALLIEHAVMMGIDGSMLMALAEANKPEADGNDAVKALMTHAQDETREAKELLSKAAAAGNSLPGNSPIRRYYGAANNYMAALANLTAGGMSPNDKAQIAAINHALMAVVNAGHILQLGSSPTNAAPAMDALTTHARMMKDEGTKTLERIGGTAPPDANAPMSPISLAFRGRELVEAGDALGPMTRMNTAGGLPGTGAVGSMTNGANGQLPLPGRLQDTRPEIIGGTYGTGSATAGTATKGEAARDIKNSTEGPNNVLNVPTPSGAPGSGPSGYGVGNNNTPPTNSTAGSRPR